MVFVKLHTSKDVNFLKEFELLPEIDLHNSAVKHDADETCETKSNNKLVTK